MTDNGSLLRILLAEDNPIDVLMTREALETWDIQNILYVVQDGQEAVDFLYRRGVYSDAERPDLMLLDLNLPKKSGIEILSEIRQDPHLSNITVLVVSTSCSEEHARMCYELGAKLCITKPLEFEEYVRALGSIQEFWFNSVAQYQ